MTTESRPPSGTWSGAELLRDLVLLVVGILVAFSLDAAWDGFTARQRLRGLIGATAVEFRENREALDSVLAMDKQAFAWAAANAWPDQPLEDSLETAPSDPRGFFLLYTYEPRNGALRALLQANELSEFGSIELVTGLTGWQARLDDLDEDQEEVWRTMEQVQFIIAEAGLSQRLNAEWTAADQAGAIPATSMFREDPRVRNYLGVHAAFVNGMVGELERLRGEMDAIIELLEGAS